MVQPVAPREMQRAHRLKLQPEHVLLGAAEISEPRRGDELLVIDDLARHVFGAGLDPVPDVLRRHRLTAS
jgi:hypothetical protein